jgi:hypothetical protein
MDNALLCNALGIRPDNAQISIPKIILRVTGGASAEDIQKAETDADIILTTYQYMSVGKSIPRMNAMVLATPRKTKSRQIINRIFRLGSDYSIERHIVDVVDHNTIFRSQLRFLKAYYAEKDYTIETVDLPL